MGTKNDIWDVNSEERGGHSMHMKPEHDRADDSDRDVDFDDDSTESCEKEYDMQSMSMCSSAGDRDACWINGPWPVGRSQ